MILERSPVRSVSEVADSIFVLRFQSPAISRIVRPGQFVNIRPDEGLHPLLRRPFSIYLTEGDEAAVIFNVIGKGTHALQKKRPGDLLDVLGPLGVPFTTDAPCDTALLIGGGLGIAPLPLTARALASAGKRVVSVIGARSAGQVVRDHLQDVRIATDDGSAGFHGTAVDCARQVIRTLPGGSIRVFACGPTPMLKATAQLAREEHLACEVSLEGPMACGFGICQGCPVELAEGERKYALMCKDGPAFDITRIRI